MLADLRWRRVSALVLAVAIAGCTGGVASPAPTPSTGATEAPESSPTSGASTPEVSLYPTDPASPNGEQLDNDQLTNALQSMAWTAIDPTTDEIVVGFGPTDVRRLELGPHGFAWATGSAVAWADEADGTTVVGVMTADGGAGPWSVDADLQPIAVRASPDGSRLYVQGMRSGEDVGLIAINTADGTRTVLVKGTEDVGDRIRNTLAVSPSGRTVLSTLCDFETCFVDVVTSDGQATRLPDLFPAYAVTDRALIGVATPGSPVEVWDLADGRATKVERDGLQPRALIAVDDKRFVINDGSDTERLYLVSPNGNVESINVPAEAKGQQLMRLPVLAGRWAALGAEGSLADILSEGLPPEVTWLDLESGELAGPVLFRTHR